MLLTISTTHRPATDLGYLLHKHPDRVQEFRQSFGTSTVLYPEATDERCTVLLTLDIDPVRLARARGKSSPDFGLAQYVNDRPYAASSLLGAAMADVFSTARSGRCDSRQELADGPIPLEIVIPVLPCRGGVGLALKIFEPLGWQVEATPIPLDEQFPEWGDSRYLHLTLRGTVRLADALNQLYVLLPVLDEAKHYWQASDEVDKLLRSGGAWLTGHPEQELIARRYLGRRGALARVALERLAELGDDTEEAVDPDSEEEVAQPEQRRVSLNAQRHAAVLQVLKQAGADSVIDLGCGPGQFLQVLLDDAVVRPRRGHRRLDARALPGRPPAPAGADGRPPARAAQPLPGRAHLRGPAVRRVRRRRPHGGHRARRPAAARRARAGRLRRGPARAGRRDDAERRVQRALRGPHGLPARRPPVRVDPRRVRGLGRAGRDDVRLPRSRSTASATSTARMASPPSWRSCVEMRASD